MAYHGEPNYSRSIEIDNDKATKIGNIIVPSDLKNIHNVTNVIAKDGFNLIHSLGSHIGNTVKVSGNTYFYQRLN